MFHGGLINLNKGTKAKRDFYFIFVIDLLLRLVSLKRLNFAKSIALSYET